MVYIEIYANTNTLKSEMIHKDSNQVDLRRYNFINCVLGLCTSGANESENMFNILHINIILVNIDLISGSYVNGSTQPTIYWLFPNVSPGYKIIENSQDILYLPITADTIHSITIWLTDQNGNELNLRGEICQCDFI